MSCQESIHIEFDNRKRFISRDMLKKKTVMMVLCQKRGEEADQNVGAESHRLDAKRRTGMLIDELSSTLQADELMLHLL